MLWPCFRTAYVASFGNVVLSNNNISLMRLKTADSLLLPANTFYQPDCILGDVDNIHPANGNIEPSDKSVSRATLEGEGQNLNLGSCRLSPPSVAMGTSKEMTAKADISNNVSPSTQAGPSPALDRPEDQNNNNQRGSSPAHSSVGHTSPSPSPPAPPSLPKVGRDCNDIIYRDHTLK